MPIIWYNSICGYFNRYLNSHYMYSDFNRLDYTPHTHSLPPPPHTHAHAHTDPPIIFVAVSYVPLYLVALILKAPNGDRRQSRHVGDEQGHVDDAMDALPRCDVQITGTKRLKGAKSGTIIIAQHQTNYHWTEFNSLKVHNSFPA